MAQEQADPSWVLTDRVLYLALTIRSRSCRRLLTPRSSTMDHGPWNIDHHSFHHLTQRRFSPVNSATGPSPAVTQYSSSLPQHGPAASPPSPLPCLCLCTIVIGPHGTSTAPNPPGPPFYAPLFFAPARSLPLRSFRTVPCPFSPRPTALSFPQVPVGPPSCIILSPELGSTQSTYRGGVNRYMVQPEFEAIPEFETKSMPQASRPPS